MPTLSLELFLCASSFHLFALKIKVLMMDLIASTSYVLENGCLLVKIGMDPSKKYSPVITISEAGENYLGNLLMLDSSGFDQFLALAESIAGLSTNIDVDGGNDNNILFQIGEYNVNLMVKSVC